MGPQLDVLISVDKFGRLFATLHCLLQCVCHFCQCGWQRAPVKAIGRLAVFQHSWDHYLHSVSLFSRLLERTKTIREYHFKKKAGVGFDDPSRWIFLMLFFTIVRESLVSKVLTVIFRNHVKILTTNSLRTEHPPDQSRGNALVASRLDLQILE